MTETPQLATVTMAFAAEPSRLDGRRQWVHLLTPGVIAARDGRAFVMDDPSAVVEASLRRAGTTEIAVDYEHQIDFAKVNGKPAPAAGWIKTLEARPDGVWGLVEWSEAAAGMIRRKEYRYVSPVLGLTADNRITLIYRVALTNTPALDLVALASAETAGSLVAAGKTADGRLVPRAASGRTVPRTPAHFLQNTFKGEDGRRSSRASLAGTGTGLRPASKRHDPMALSPALLKALSLPDDADEDAALDAIDELRERAAESRGTSATLSALTTMMSDLNNQQAVHHRDRVEAKVVQAIRDGVILPAQKDWAVALCAANEASFDEFVAKTGHPFAVLFRTMVTPEMEARLSAQIAADGGWQSAEPSLSGKIARQLGIDPKELD